MHYGQSKLAQVLWAQELTRRLGDGDGSNDVFVNAAHPGAVDSSIWDKYEMHIPQFLIDLLDIVRKNAMWTTEDGALTQLFLGVAVDRIRDEDIRGRYFHPQAQEVVHPYARHEKLQKDLWKFSDELISDFL